MKTTLSAHTDMSQSPDRQEASPGAWPSLQPRTAGVNDAQVHALAQACWQEAGQPLLLLQSWAQAGTDWEDIYLQGVVPAAQLLGQWWLADRMDFVAVSIASTRLQQTLYDLSPTFLSQACDANNGLSALLFCCPGSQHTMGVFMLGEFFRKSGWQVSGVPFPGAASALRSVQSGWFDVLGLSVGTTRCLETVGSLIRNLRAASANPALKIMVGGPMAASHRGLMLSLGADFIGGDARESLRLAHQYVKQDPRCQAEYGPCAITIDTSKRIQEFTLAGSHAARP